MLKLETTVTTRTERIPEHLKSPAVLVRTMVMSIPGKTKDFDATLARAVKAILYSPDHQDKVKVQDELRKYYYLGRSIGTVGEVACVKSLKRIFGENMVTPATSSWDTKNVDAFVFGRPIQIKISENMQKDVLCYKSPSVLYFDVATSLLTELMQLNVPNKLINAIRLDLPVLINALGKNKRVPDSWQILRQLALIGMLEVEGIDSKIDFYERQFKSIFNFIEWHKVDKNFVHVTIPASSINWETFELNDDTALQIGIFLEEARRFRTRPSQGTRTFPYTYSANRRPYYRRQKYPTSFADLM